MSYKAPTYQQIDNDQVIGYITPNVIVIIAVGVVLAISHCDRR